MGRLDGKVALISGAASGIGAASARRFAEEGARIAGFDLQAPVAGGDWEAAVAVAPGASFQAGVDVREESAIEETVAGAIAAHGPIDILLNAAGISGVGAAHQLAAKDWDLVLDVNLKGSFLVAKHTLPSMLEKGSGSIIHVASVEGLEGMGGSLSYNASKGGVVLMTKNMAIDYGTLGIRVNCLCPGLIETPLTQIVKDTEVIRRQMVGWHALDRAGQPVEVANAALFLASDEASFVTGHALVVDGGWTAGRRFTG